MMWPNQLMEGYIQKWRPQTAKHHLVCRPSQKVHHGSRGQIKQPPTQQKPLTVGQHRLARAFPRWKGPLRVT